MTPAAKLAGFAVVLVAALGGGAAVGRAVGPIDVGGDGPDVGHGGHEVPQVPGGSGTTEPVVGGHATQHDDGGIIEGEKEP